MADIINTPSIEQYLEKIKDFKYYDFTNIEEIGGKVYRSYWKVLRQCVALKSFNLDLIFKA